LDIWVEDDGIGTATTPWQPGVGMVAMRERTAELGGSLQAGPGPTGGRVTLRLPLGQPAPAAFVSTIPAAHQESTLTAPSTKDRQVLEATP
jgi:signal transduction histidine kinase